MKKGKNFIVRLFRRQATPVSENPTPVTVKERLTDKDIEKIVIEGDIIAKVDIDKGRIEIGIEKSDIGDANMEAGNSEESVDETTGSTPDEGDEEASERPTICKGGKLFNVRLRNGRWETIGPPIGDC